MQMMKLRLFSFLFLFAGDLLFATEYFCDPASGNMNNDGSKNAPWSTLEDVFNSGKTFQPGDMIWLLNGYHGNVSVNGKNSDFVTIRNYENSTPKLSRLTFGISGETSKWIVDGLIIGAEYNSTYHKNTLLYTGKLASYIKIQNTTIFTKEDITAWSKTDWISKVSNGVIFQGTFCSIENSTVKNIRTGIQFEGDNCTASNNKIKNFAGDGMRGLADYGTFEYNVVQDNYVIDTNHDDGFQSWTDEGGVGKGTISNIVLRGNIIINYTDSNRDFLGPLQGIFGTDGMFDNFVIENNIVLVDQWHGISLYGAKNCKIINNTVIDIYFGVTYPDHPDSNYRGPLGPAWIKIASHKDGTLSKENIVRNNIANQIITEQGSGVQDHNLILNGSGSVEYEKNFVNWKAFDVHLLQNSAAVDQGSENKAPSIDADGNSRPAGNAFDIGAYEYSGALGVEDEDFKDGIILYPTYNLTGEFYFRSDVPKDDLRIILYDVAGKKLDSAISTPASSVSGFYFKEYPSLPPGFYIISVQNSIQKSSFKIYKPI